MADIIATTEPLLKPSAILRYDRPHAGSAASGVQQRTAEELTPTGEADMEMSGPGSVGGGHADRPAELRPAPEVTSAASALERDDVDVARTAQLLERLSHDPEIRAERLARIRAEIANGTYETTEKLERAVERLLREIG
jgi:negative regulator of flagellin synthesis FlgM